MEMLAGIHVNVSCSPSLLMSFVQGPKEGMAEGALFPKAGRERGDKIDGLDGLAGLKKEKKLQHDSSSEKLSLFAKLADAVRPFYTRTHILGGCYKDTIF